MKPIPARAPELPPEMERAIEREYGLELLHEPSVEAAMRVVARQLAERDAEHAEEVEKHRAVAAAEIRVHSGTMKRASIAERQVWGLRVLREALEWYADENNYDEDSAPGYADEDWESGQTTWEIDGGARARAALAVSPATEQEDGARRATILVSTLRRKLAEMELHDDLPDSHDIGYMACWRELRTWLDTADAPPGGEGADTTGVRQRLASLGALDDRLVAADPELAAASPGEEAKRLRDEARVTALRAGFERVTLPTDPLFRILEGLSFGAMYLNPPEDWKPEKFAPPEEYAGTLANLYRELIALMRAAFDEIESRADHRWRWSGTFDTGHQPPRARWDCVTCGAETWTSDPDGPVPFESSCEPAPVASSSSCGEGERWDDLLSEIGALQAEARAAHAVASDAARGIADLLSSVEVRVKRVVDEKLPAVVAPPSGVRDLRERDVRRALAAEQREETA